MQTLATGRKHDSSQRRPERMMRGPGEELGFVSIPAFVDEVTTGAETWVEDFGDGATVTRNLEKFARFRPDGLPPFFAGPVIA